MKLPVILSALIILSSCATILNGKYQKVEVSSNSDSMMMINNEKDTVNGAGNDEYRLRRDMKGTQIITKKEGYLDNYSCVLQYKRSPLYIMSWIPFGITFYAPLMDNGVKAFNYPRVHSVKNNDNRQIPNKTEDDKYISVNAVKMEIAKEDFTFSRQVYKSYLKGHKINSRSVIESDEAIKIDNSIFDIQLNRILKEKGYIDTANKVLKNSFSNKVYLNLVVNSVSINNIYGKQLGAAYSYQANSFYTVDLNTTWEILDYYKQPIYSVTYETKSGEFVYDRSENDESELKAFKNALEIGLSNLFQDEEFIKNFGDNTELDKELSYEKLQIHTPTKKVSSLSESIKASVTITNGKGHGSGFFISNLGHIITNYHVVIDTNKAKVVLNNGKEYDYTIIRTSKKNDLALIKINLTNEFAYELQKGEVELGNEIYAVGTPSGQDLQQSISKGIVSGLRSRGGGAKLIQTDASINGGNSGGAIILKNGMAVGVVSSKLVGVGIEGVAFGIPSTEVFEALKIEFK